MSTGDVLKMGPDAGPELSGDGLRADNQDSLLVLFKDSYKKGAA